jgi:hypothetical protein
MSGLTLTPSYRDCNSDRDTGWCRPDLVGNYQVSSPDQYGWFATTGTNSPLTANGQVIGAWGRPQKGQFGSVGRNRITGPNFSQLDTSFFKTFQVTEKLNAQFRAEVFNLPNHTNLGQPNTCVDCPGVAGRIFATFQQYLPRQAQLALRFEF